MARIVEELVLRDRFTSTYRNYLGYTERAEQSTNRLMDSVRNLAGAYIGLQGIQGLARMSDTFTQTTARLDLMNDGLQTTAELNQMIYESAQRARGSYADTAAIVSKLGTLAGDAFSSSAEIVAFAEQLNKQMVLSGTGKMERDAAMLQLTQGLASGTLRGEELNSVLEQTPLIAQTIAKYMGVNIGEMRELASEGMVTADIVKNAMFAAADETNAKFEQMPMTWSQVWAKFANMALMYSKPILQVLSWLANNIAIIAPLVLAAGGAFAVFQLAANYTRIAAAATAAYNFVVNLLSIGFGVLTGNTAAASAAMYTFNSALLANPVTWVTMGVMLLVGALYAGVAAWNHFTDSGVSATGIVVGVVATGGALVGNIFIGTLNGMIQAVWSIFVNPFIGIVEWVLNVANGGFNSFGAAVANLIGQIISWFLSLGKVVTNIIDAIFGTDWTAGLNSLQNSVISWGKNDSAITLDRQAATIDHRFSYSGAYDWGYQKGSNLFGGAGGLNAFGEPDYGAMVNNAALDNLKSIDNNTKAIKKSVDMSDEDLKSFIDLATSKYVNNINLTAQSPVINVSGQNTGDSEADRKALADTLRDMLIEQSASASIRSISRVT